MRTTIDRAGRVVIPKPLRDAVGLVPGEVEILVEGAALRVAPVALEGTVERRGRLVIDADLVLTDADVDALRFADQR
ncbi:MAG: AbrB/MazE/SpoVT family DNA-binding domain-containing protein [Acidimicrobiia bacterium]